MHLVINGEKKEYANKSLNITELLEIEKVKNPDVVSVQLNGQFVDKVNYSTTSLKEGDEVEFLYFIGGGK
ncbi:sulfur carrier protein ThiS [Thermospira aquatica]|uniref:Sulfur carrier protein ThiS n=1 Tax=Thermospira aquatica TaxID=2828656 RepID=A0AAX3BAF0_9SPIR|nr:sulfur carrier protein ThiS [Thermospira aquatica]URA09238.1 sulfur carrier protein ThiS [Thermospira aquatica]